MQYRARRTVFQASQSLKPRGLRCAGVTASISSIVYPGCGQAAGVVWMSAVSLGGKKSRSRAARVVEKERCDAHWLWWEVAAHMRRPTGEAVEELMAALTSLAACAEATGPRVRVVVDSIGCWLLLADIGGDYRCKWKWREDIVKRRKESAQDIKCLKVACVLGALNALVRKQGSVLGYSGI